MHDYLADLELTRLAIVLGVIVGLLIYQRTGITFGGVIVPGYLAIFITRPSHILVTMGCAVLTWWVIDNFVLKRRIIYGRELFETEILIAVILQALWTALVVAIGNMNPNVLIFTGVGFVVPGVLAHDIRRQGIKRTLSTAVMGAIVIAVLIELIAGLRDILPNLQKAIPPPLMRSQSYEFSFPLDWLPIAIVFGILIAMAVFRIFKIRPSGFVPSAYLAILIARPMSIFLILLSAGITYLIVTQFIVHIGIVFGRAKLGSMVLVGVLVAWIVEMLILYISHGRYVPWSGFTAIMPMIVALLANEFERQGPVATITATSISTIFTYFMVEGMMFFVNFLRFTS